MAARAKITHHVINQRFTSMGANSQEIEACDNLAEYYREVATNVAAVLPEGRYKSMVITSLEEAMFWSQRSMVEGIRYNRPVNDE